MPNSIYKSLDCLTIKNNPLILCKKTLRMHYSFLIWKISKRRRRMVATYMPWLLRRHGMYIVPRYCALPQSCLSIQSLFQMENFPLINWGKDYFFLFRDWAYLYSFKIQFFSSENFRNFDFSFFDISIRHKSDFKQDLLTRFVTNFNLNPTQIKRCQNWLSCLR